MFPAIGVMNAMTRERLAARRNSNTAFTIDSDDNIAVYAGTPTSAGNFEPLASEKELEKLAADWPASRLVESGTASRAWLRSTT
jgi:hypothetical protein